MLAEWNLIHLRRLDQYICSAGGVAAGTATAGAGVPAAILACNVAQVVKRQQAENQDEDAS